MKAPRFLKILFFSLTLIMHFSKGNSQQLLWSTASDANENKIPKSQVITEVLKQYDFYNFYYDATGYSKESFGSMLKGEKGITGASTSKNSKVDSWLAGIKEPTILAWKDNTGKGSLVMVLSIDGDNVDLLVFSNQIESGFISTHESDRNKFSKWLNTLYKLESKKETSESNYENQNYELTDADLIPQLYASNLQEEPVTKVAVKASFPGGESSFRDFIANEFEYPIRCKEEGINGSVVLKFVVDKSGRISRVSAIQDTKSCPEFTEEAIRVIKKSPRWIPGQNKGRFVISWREIPIRMSAK